MWISSLSQTDDLCVDCVSKCISVIQWYPMRLISHVISPSLASTSSPSNSILVISIFLAYRCVLQQRHLPYSTPISVSPCLFMLPVVSACLHMCFCVSDGHLSPTSGVDAAPAVTGGPSALISSEGNNGRPLFPPSRGKLFSLGTSTKCWIPVFSLFYCDRRAHQTSWQRLGTKSIVNFFCSLQFLLDFFELYARSKWTSFASFQF